VNIAITGASGLIGRRLIQLLASRGHSLRVLSRRGVADLPPEVRLSLWDPEKGEPAEDALRDTDAVVHLAGENVAQRWTEDAKRRIRESRELGTRRLVCALARLPRRPSALVCASAIGYYGSRGDEALTESSAPGAGFLPGVCMAWEREAVAAEALGIRVVRVRIGILLDPRGGALQRMLPPFRLGLGGRLGDGRQWMSWIHRDDLAELFRFAIEKPIRGALNAVAPNPIPNAGLTRELARAVHRPAIFPVPKFALRLMFGEMSEVLLASQKVAPNAAASAGFVFRFPHLGAALVDLLGG
jgi:uncharacterized protein (TIGR01777 family)